MDFINSAAKYAGNLFASALASKLSRIFRKGRKGRRANKRYILRMTRWLASSIVGTYLLAILSRISSVFSMRSMLLQLSRHIVI